MSTKMQLEWRRRQVFELNSEGQSQTEISRILRVHNQQRFGLLESAIKAKHQKIH
ncbi:MAG: hypothetical protein ACJ708_12125 [Nitrososphaeraceae archaeon]